MQNFSLYWHTIKYLKPVQIYGRIFASIKKYISKNSIIPPEDISSTYFINKKSEFLFHDPWNNRDNIIQGNFTFLNDSKKIGFPPEWEISANLLWKFNLHYFKWLHLLNRKEQNNIVNDWIVKNPLGKEIAWHPYVTSLRIVSWCKNKISQVEHLRNLYTQAEYLYRNLEYYHPANHYLENARALIFAGNYLKCDRSDIWIKKGFEILRNELHRQILSDGAHFELSPMYHCIVLELILDVINLTDDNLNGLLKDYAIKMRNYLESILDDNFNFPLFNDSTYEIAPSPKILLEYFDKLNIKQTTNPVSTISEVSGVNIVKNEKLFLAIDGGKIGPDNIPAHAHADIFNYELKVSGKEFIVDCGVYEYTKGEMRDYCRSTKAHNCVTIDGINQAQIWDSFRVGRRYHPYDVKFYKNNDEIIFEGKFNGYSKLIGDKLIHYRTIKIKDDFKKIIISDLITGKGNHLIENWIHFHPFIKLQIIEKNILSISRDNVEIILTIKENDFKVIKGYYCPEFGLKLENDVLVIYSKKVPCNLQYEFIIN